MATMMTDVFSSISFTTDSKRVLVTGTSKSTKQLIL